MQGVRCNAEPVGFTTDLVQRHEPVVDVEGGVLDALRGHRARHLLEFADELQVLAPLFFGDIVRFLQKKAADEIEHDAGMTRIAALGFGGRMLDVASVVVAHFGLASVDVRPIDRERRDDLPHRVREAVVREVTVVTVPLGEPVQAVGQHVELTGHAHAKDELLAAVCEFAKRRAQAGEALERLVHRALISSIDEQPVHQDQEVVSCRPFHWP